MTAFENLINQVDSFIRKYYKNELIKGSLFVIGTFILSFLLVTTLEYLGRFNSFVRAVLLFGFILTNAYILGRYFALPLLRLRSFGKRIDRYQASRIIGSFFPGIADRLLNTLQLHDTMNSNSADYELLAASVQQRSETMRMVPFADAIDLKENNKYAFWLLPIVLIFASLFYWSPGVFKQGTERVLNFSQDFPVIAPYSYNLVSNTNNIEEGSDVLVELSLKGDELPRQVYLRTNKGKFLMKQVGRNSFQSTIPQVRNTQNFSFTSDYRGYEIMSEDYTLEVIGKSAIGKFDASLNYPKYLGMPSETLNNATELTVPEGTLIDWSVLAKNCKEIEWIWENGKALSFKNDGFSVAHLAKESLNASIVLKNRYSSKRDTLALSLLVIKDAFPGIHVAEVKDSLRDGVRFFSGHVEDDHGLRSLNFHYTITRKNGEKVKRSMPVRPVAGLEQEFDYAVDFRREDVKLEDRVEYYFSVGDNDGVNGSKYTSSSVFTYQLPNLDELVAKRDEEQGKVSDEMKALQEKVAKFNEDLERLKKEAMNSKNSSWKQQNQAEKLKNEHQSILEKLSETKELMNRSLEEKNQLNEVDEELLEKQDLLNDLMEELMDDELKELLEKLEDLLKDQNKDELERAFEELEMNSEDMKKQLDRSIEMMKKMRVDEKIDDVEEQLKSLSDEQEQLKKDVEVEKLDKEKALEEQEKINEKFQDLKEDIQELDSLNQDLNRPMELGDMERRTEDIQEQLNDAKESLSKGKSAKAGESQKSAGEKMDQMAEDLDQAQQESNQQQQEEDLSMLRRILESLLILSTDQESVMKTMALVRDEDPAFIKNGRVQRKIVSDTRIVADSLYELAKRQPKIASFIDEELNQIHTNQEMAIEDIDERRRRELGIHQQYAMTSYNNLALMLNESLQQMQAAMQNAKPGSGSCNKPGGKGVPKPGEGMSPGNMKDMLKKQLEQMQKGAEGSKPGEGKKPGQPGGSGMVGNQGLAKMAAEQGAIRRRLEQLRKELNKDGSGKGNQLNPLIQELEKQEDDIINKRIDRQTIERQKEILTRLLESEKALMERGWDEKRESKEGKSEPKGNKIEFTEYTKERLKQIELLRSVDPMYRKYYKDRANEYLNRVP